MMLVDTKRIDAEIDAVLRKMRSDTAEAWCAHQDAEIMALLLRGDEITHAPTENTTVKIKWRDQHGGAVKNERCEKISEGKALGMLKRANPADYDWCVTCLNMGDEVPTKNFTLKKD